MFPIEIEIKNSLKNCISVNWDSNTEWLCINTPFLDVFNNSIEIFVKIEGNNTVLTDAGQTLRNLELNGIAYDSEQVIKIRKIINLNFGVLKNERNELMLQCNTENVAQKLISLISSMIKLNTLIEIL